VNTLATLPVTASEWRALREQNGLSVAELADLTGLTPATIQRLELGAHCTESTRRLIGAALGLPVFEVPR
jgi:transcriptional regulator with XRE-family HTH domain